MPTLSYICSVSYLYQVGFFGGICIPCYELLAKVGASSGAVIG